MRGVRQLAAKALIMANHNEKPEYAELTAEDRQRLESITQSNYFASLQSMCATIVGRTVAHSQAGGSGFILFFRDGSYAISYLQDGYLKCHIGSGEPTESESTLINSPDYGDGSSAVSEDLPYADEGCDISTEILQAHGEPVMGLAIGEKTFNFCFPAGKELETMLVSDRNNKLALRVFWEQW